MLDFHKSSLVEALLSHGPAPDRAAQMALYGRLVGDWEMDAVVYRDDGSTHTGQGKIHFGWALEGRAIQDVWILPDVFYGTTLRIYDPNLDAWHILWSDPLQQYYTRQLGRPHGEDITQKGKDASGADLRWRFKKIAANSFRWLGERSIDNGATWQLQAEFLARRIARDPLTRLAAEEGGSE